MHMVNTMFSGLDSLMREEYNEDEKETDETKKPYFFEITLVYSYINSP